MSDNIHLERWALERAHKIMLHEGMSLMNAAQWLDKQQTRKSTQNLRDAIQRSLIDAAMLKRPAAPADETGNS